MAKGTRLLRQAKREARIRYGPEIRALRELLAQARTDLKHGIKAETGAAQGIRAAAKEARPEIRRSYGNAGLTFQQADADVAAAGGTSQASLREAAGAKRRLSESLAGAEEELADRQVQAEQGRQYGVRNLQRTFQGEKEKISRQATGLAGDIGAFTQSTFRELKDADVKLGLEKKRLKLSIQGERRAQRKTEADLTGIDPKTGRPTAQEVERRRQARSRRRDDERQERKDREGDKDGGKPKFTPTQRTNNRAQWDKAKLVAERLEARGDVSPAKWVELVVKVANADPVVARGAVQLVRWGGVDARVRRRLQRDYGLKPKVARRIAKPGTGGVLDLG